MYNYRKGAPPWWLERSAAHLLQFSAYVDVVPFGSHEHDGIETLQTALGSNVHSGAGIAMPFVAFGADGLRSGPFVLRRLLQLLRRRCRLHLDAGSDWYETMLAVAAG